ncbi:predicted protein [Uncinocarpus reesii 1704]|uniref:F-box domain-containing protein n=1 Tax=Uncinocarpus reesii (strain UAMH 1704) TaxID=336963 RepID=C4JWG7_UNCRE|nr:uncharacterized protein UREG_06909 [Uncinocarpus reesii 1704]EEP82044.1 predicted protein [Uncinocarpus reesii 1704]
MATTFPCKAELAGMPNELLYHIAENVEDNKDLNSLVQTCRDFYDLLNPELYRRDARLSGASALWWAAERGSVETAKKAVEAGADVNSVRTIGLRHKETLLLSTVIARARAKLMNNAAKRDAVFTILEMLLENGVNVNYMEEETGFNPIESAVIDEDYEVVKLLLEHGAQIPADISGHGSFAHILIQWPGRAPSFELLELLLTHGLDANARNQSGSTALHLIAERQFKEGLEPVLALLLRHGADIHAKNGQNRTALELAMEEATFVAAQGRTKFDARVLKLFLESGADTSTVMRPRLQVVREAFEEVEKKLGRTFSFCG